MLLESRFGGTSCYVGFFYDAFDVLVFFMSVRTADGYSVSHSLSESVCQDVGQSVSQSVGQSFRERVGLSMDPSGATHIRQ